MVRDSCYFHCCKNIHWLNIFSEFIWQYGAKLKGTCLLFSLILSILKNLSSTTVCGNVLIKWFEGVFLMQEKKPQLDPTRIIFVDLLGNHRIRKISKVVLVPNAENYNVGKKEPIRIQESWVKRRPLDRWLKMKIFQVSNAPWLSEKANTILLWMKAFRIYNTKERNNSKAHKQSS